MPATDLEILVRDGSSPVTNGIRKCGPSLKIRVLVVAAILVVSIVVTVIVVTLNQDTNHCQYSSWTSRRRGACTVSCAGGHQTVDYERSRSSVQHWYHSSDCTDVVMSNLSSCNTMDCPDWSTWESTVRSSMYQSSRPCDDFYSYACWGWNRATPIPSGKKSYNLFTKLIEETYHSILHSLQTQSRTNASSNALSFYTSCTEYAPKDREATIAMLKSFVSKYTQDSTYEYDMPDNLEDRLEGSHNMLSRIHQYDIWPLFQLTSRTSPQDRSTQILTMTIGHNPFEMEYESELRASIREELIDEAITAEIKSSLSSVQTSAALSAVQSSMDISDDDARSFLKSHKENSALIFNKIWGYPMGLGDGSWNLNYYNGKTAVQMTDELLDFEVKLMKAMTGNDKDNYGKEEYRVMTIRELHYSCGMTTWNTYFKHLFRDSLLINEVLVVAPNVMFEVCRVVSEAKRETLQNYILITYVKTMLTYYKYSHVLHPDDDFDDTNVAEYKANKWLTCMVLTELAFPKVFGHVYVQNMPKEDHSEKVGVILKYVKKAYTDHILQDPWLDSTTREMAIRKVNHMLDKIGYPKSILNKALLDQEYSKFVVVGHKWLDAVLIWKEFSFNQLIKTLTQPTDRMAWILSPSTVNAVHAPLINDITVPSAIMRLPVFDHRRPMAMNFGSLGSIIGHEMTHAFGLIGKCFNEYGQMSDWMSMETERVMTKKAKCFVTQYPELDPHFEGVSGNKTLEENIADNGGIRAAFYAYQAWKKDHTSAEVLDVNVTAWMGDMKLTEEQLFFLSYSQMYCAKYTVEGLQQSMLIDGHSPFPLRVKGPLSNTEFFQQTYSCPASSNYASGHRCQLW